MKLGILSALVLVFLSSAPARNHFPRQRSLLWAPSIVVAFRRRLRAEWTPQTSIKWPSRRNLPALRPAHPPRPPPFGLAKMHDVNVFDAFGRNPRRCMEGAKPAPRFS
ncbi:hypothetical protein PCL_02645 [Purpureocillium lilacinum]|uniref:Secreted protein n=1 Tax=Purpureocillium lilacinum TaxID=33203 RepID=A0A2U3DZQ4_PURLI|nr:hypothetical protein Purlil1_10068 [Purpureocillium lilacinum]PWI67724.1 hypothetical protein PCL_02645 [Purpureocillium lilacinum]